MNQKLHSKATSEQCLIGSFAHFKQVFDSLVFALPRQHIGISLDHDYIDEVKTLFVVFGVGTGVELEKVVRDGDAVPSVNLRRAL